MIFHQTVSLFCFLSHLHFIWRQYISIRCHHVLMTTMHISLSMHWFSADSFILKIGVAEWGFICWDPRSRFMVPQRMPDIPGHCVAQWPFLCYTHLYQIYCFFRRINRDTTNVYQNWCWFKSSVSFSEYVTLLLHSSDRWISRLLAP